MDDKKKRLLRAWLERATNDLGSAELLLSGSEQYLGSALYHCQQASEKALKAFLVLHDVDFEKIHNLVVLVRLCAKVDPQFLRLEELAVTLTPYATIYRYPNEVDPGALEPAVDEAQEGLRMAQEIFSLVESSFPEDLQ